MSQIDRTTDRTTARIEAALRRLGATHEPPPGWQARVLAAVQAPSRRRGAGWSLAVFALAAALLLASPPARPDDLELVVARDARGPIVRGKAAHVGDLLRATARGGAGFRAIWVYRNEVELVAVCPGSTGCRIGDGATTAELSLGALGRYTVVALSSPSPLPAPLGAYDQDVAAAGDAGATLRIDELDVR